MPGHDELGPIAASIAVALLGDGFFGGADEVDGLAAGFFDRAAHPEAPTVIALRDVPDLDNDLVELSGLEGHLNVFSQTLLAGGNIS